ncbi:hypothetical protein K435DRAFT_811754 [Dendrothele bispora CBS 962.96]|uniref:Uncharacterized protein n=1 Tax=Dendrothele bispora (strain CBS 962.96) TaxID=1314807 RepID=A0A4S8KPR9_DENBC|nr:hypothetical protein K435DRAFT_812213 [Dendrothele bispora CBS 962.96]THU78206.1 hypothetical protein K435DRAFT_811754 [Dendrothele bispora CBS 962.96]
MAFACRPSERSSHLPCKRPQELEELYGQKEIVVPRRGLPVLLVFSSRHSSYSAQTLGSRLVSFGSGLMRQRLSWLSLLYNGLCIPYETPVVVYPSQTTVFRPVGFSQSEYFPESYILHVNVRTAIALIGGKKGYLLELWSWVRQLSTAPFELSRTRPSELSNS